MAPPLVVAQAAVMRLLYASSGQLCVNVLGLLITGNPTIDQAMANTLGAAMKTAFLNNWAVHMTPGSALVRVSIRDIRQANLTEYFDTNPQQVGTGVGDPLPTQTALCITLRTAKSGKSFRGRTYLPGGLETDNTNSVATAGTSTAGVAYLNAINSALGGLGFNLGVLSRPAERQTVVRTTFHADGSQTADVLSETKAKTGSIERVTAVESRTSDWETQRRRANRRGAPPAGLFDAVARAEL